MCQSSHYFLNAEYIEYSSLLLKGAKAFAFELWVQVIGEEI